MKKNIALQVLEHPEKEEILNKLIIGLSPKDIHEWLAALFSNPAEKSLIISEKNLNKFKDEYLDMYSIIKEDLTKVSTALTAGSEVQSELQGSPNYQKSLERYLKDEIDIKLEAKKLLAMVSTRAEQIFFATQKDTENTRPDYVLIQYLNTLAAVLEKLDTIVNGNSTVNIQNNVNIQLLDTHINTVYNIIKEILSKLDYETSLEFISLFNERMKAIEAPSILSQEEKTSQLGNISETINKTQLVDRT
jgi:hypothetical protein